MIYNNNNVKQIDDTSILIRGTMQSIRALNYQYSRSGKCLYRASDCPIKCVRAVGSYFHRTSYRKHCFLRWSRKDWWSRCPPFGAHVRFLQSILQSRKLSCLINHQLVNGNHVPTIGTKTIKISNYFPKSTGTLLGSFIYYVFKQWGRGMSLMTLIDEGEEWWMHMMTSSHLFSFSLT